MQKLLVCWNCGASLEGKSLPFTRLAECTDCGAEIHVCKMCKYFDSRLANQCAEPMAEPVQEKHRANFCDYYQAKPSAYVAEHNAEAEAARHQLEMLFGSAGVSSREANILPERDEPLSESALARKKLEALFHADKH